MNTVLQGRPKSFVHEQPQETAAAVAKPTLRMKFRRILALHCSLLAYWTQHTAL